VKDLLKKPSHAFAVYYIIWPLITSNGRLLHRAFLACGFYLSLQCNLISYYKLNWLIGKASLLAVLCFFTDFMKLDSV